VKCFSGMDSPLRDIWGVGGRKQKKEKTAILNIWQALGRWFGFTKDAVCLFFHKGNEMTTQIVKPGYLI
jgi:hypothetical protein